LATFDFTVNDAGLGVVAAQMDIDVTVVNDVPVATDDEFAVDEDTTLNGDVGLNDSDVDGDTLTFSIISGPSKGAVILATDGTFVYTPNADFFGTDQFEYSADDPFGGHSSGTVVIVVHSVDDPPSTSERELLDAPDEEPRETDTEPPATEEETETDDGVEDDVEDQMEEANDKQSEKSTLRPRRPASVNSDAGAEEAATAELTSSPTTTEVAVVTGDARGDVPRMTRHRTGVVGTDTVAIDTWYVHDTFVGFDFQSHSPSADELTAPKWELYWDAIATLDEEVGQEQKLEVVVGTAAVVTTAASLTYALWSIRGASLAASMMSTLPAWAMIDPLPIADANVNARAATSKCRDDETLEEIAKQGARNEEDRRG
jgi:hypothetical protein